MIAEPLLLSILSCSLALAGALLVGFGVFLFKASSRRFPRRPAHPVLDLKAGKERKPSVFDPKEVQLTVVIPAYREEQRIGVMLVDTIEYLENRVERQPGFSAEVIVVDDGSPDGTSKQVNEACSLIKSNAIDLGLIRFSQNQGKGAAISEGILSARGHLILFADADGATRAVEVEKLERALKRTDGGLACGSRSIPDDDCKVKRNALRYMLMLAFKLFVRLWGVHSVRDTQCGFKLMDRDTAKNLVSNLRLNRWIFDVELIHLAEAMQRPIYEVPVNWTEMDGSKLCLAVDSVKMALDLVFMRMAYALRLWKIYT